MTEQEYLDENGCAKCHSPVQVTNIFYTCPGVYEYECESCNHQGQLKRSRIPHVNIAPEQYDEYSRLKQEVGLDKAVELLGGTIDYGEWEYK